jgi:hypothetical protein
MAPSDKQAGSVSSIATKWLFFQRPLIQSYLRNAKRPVTNQRMNRRRARRAVCGIQVFFGAAPTPSAISAKDSTGELIQGTTILCRRKGGEPAVPDNLGCNSLQELFPPAFQHLQVRVTVHVNKSGGHDQPAAIDFGGIDKVTEATHSLNRVIFDQQVGSNGWGSTTINHASVLED